MDTNEIVLYYRKYRYLKRFTVKIQKNVVRFGNTFVIQETPMTMT